MAKERMDELEITQKTAYEAGLKREAEPNPKAESKRETEPNENAESKRETEPNQNAETKRETEIEQPENQREAKDSGGSLFTGIYDQLPDISVKSVDWFILICVIAFVAVIVIGVLKANHIF